MPPKTPRLTAKQVIQLLKDAGFIEVSQVGSHLKLFNKETRRIAIVPYHNNRVLPMGTLKSIEKQAGLEW